jgi:hypothetical protein
LKPAVRKPPARLGLAEYYLVEALNAYGTTVFFLGVFFHARLLHGFSDAANLLLAATQGGAYVLATRAGGRFADRVGPDRSVALGLAGMCLALLVGWRSTQPGALFAAVGLYSAATALTWPALEAAIARAPGRTQLARRTGLYNVIWSFTGSAGFFAGGALFAFDPEAVFWAPLAAHAIELLGFAVRSWTPKMDVPSPETKKAEGWRGGAGSIGGPQGARWRSAASGPRSPHGTPERRLSPAAQARYLRAAWLANGVSYFLFGAFAALAPTLGERLGLGPRLAIWLVSAHLFARSGAFVLFWRWEGWEYRRGWLASALVLPPAAFAAAFFTPSPRVAIGALAVLGAMSGLAYSASLHASLDREGGEGEGGGAHEWVIGLGILFGPLAGAAGVRLWHGTAGAGGLVTVLGAAAALAGLAPLVRRLERLS